MKTKDIDGWIMRGLNAIALAGVIGIASIIFFGFSVMAGLYTLATVFFYLFLAAFVIELIAVIVFLLMDW